MRQGRVLGVVVIAAALLAVPGGAAAQPTTRLVEQRTVAADTQRLTYRYGPIAATAGQNLILIGPATIERPPGPGFITRFRPDLVRAATGEPPMVDEIHMHHAVFLNMNERDLTAPGLPERFFAFGEEKTIGQLPAGYGYRVDPTDVWAINYMVHNATPSNDVVFIEYEVDVVAADSPTGRGLTPVRPVWMDVRNGEAYPVFDALRRDAQQGKVLYPRDGSYGTGRPLNEWRVPRDLTLVAGAGHVHPGGLSTDLSVRRDDAEQPLFSSQAVYFDGEPISWDMAMTAAPDDWRVGLRQGDVLRLTTTYEGERASWYESMGILLAYAADEPGPNPFGTPPPLTGEVTHAPLPENANRGGKEVDGAPVPSELPGGRTPDGRVGIAAFSYLPGDLGHPYPPGYVPTVRPGERLRYGNLDAAAQIFHTITACKPPCTATTGIAYPLADGEVDFDSGELGYGPRGFTAAANRAEWDAPTDVAPGTYTFFCRVHPFMRGAFRVE